MTNPQDSHVKVIKTEYVDSAVAKKQLTPQQQELKDALNSFPVGMISRLISGYLKPKISVCGWKIIAPTIILKGSAPKVSIWMILFCVRKRKERLWVKWLAKG